MNLLSENLTATNSLVSTLATVNKSLLIVSSFAFVGILLAFAFLLLEREGVLQESAQKLRKLEVQVFQSGRLLVSLKSSSPWQIFWEVRLVMPLIPQLSDLLLLK